MAPTTSSKSSPEMRVVDESIRSLPGVDQTWWASTVSVEKESYWLEPPQDGVLLDD